MGVDRFFIWSTSGRESFGSLALAKELEGFDELSLSFGVNRIEEQRGLAAAAGSGKDHDAVFGNVQVNVFQVVGVSVPDDDSVVVLHSCK